VGAHFNIVKAVLAMKLFSESEMVTMAGFGGTGLETATRDGSGAGMVVLFVLEASAETGFGCLDSSFCRAGEATAAADFWCFETFA